MATTQLNRRRFLQTGAVATAAGVAAARGAGPGKVFAKAPAVQGTTNLKVMVWGRPDSANWLAEAARRTNPELAGRVTVEPVIGGSGDQEVAEQFRLMLSAGGDDLPDIIRFNRIQVPEFAAADVLTDLTDLVQPYAADMIESATALATFDEKVVAVPAQLKPKVWFYRQDIFEQAGIDPSAVTTMDEFVAAGQTLHTAVPESYIFSLRATPPGYLTGGILTSYAPVSFYDRDAGQFQVDSHPGFRAIFETLDKLKDPNVAAPVDDFSPEWAGAFADSTITSSLIADWMASFLPGYVPDQAGLWKVHPWPFVGDSNQGSDAGGAVWVIPKGAKNPEAAFELLANAHLTTEGALAMVGLGGLTPYITSARDQVKTMPKPEAGRLGRESSPLAAGILR